MNQLTFSLALLFVFTEFASAQVVRERDVIYQQIEGVSLTYDVFKPEKPNGIGIIKIVSGGWKSSHSKIKEGFSSPYTDQGYTVFAVMHGSQPRYKVRDIMGFVHRAVRHIRANADEWGIDPDRIGVTGSSAGGHLSLVLATKGGPGDPKAKDPIDRVSSAVQAAAVFYPPTDYLNWSKPGDDCVGVGKQERWQPAFGDESETAETRQVLGRHMSSIYHISEDTPPVLIIHGDADPIVPLFQSISFRKVAVSKGVPIELVIKEGGKHGWPNKQADETHFVKWFDRYLLNAEASGYRIGACDWSLGMKVSADSFQFAKENGLDGIQYSFDEKGNGLDLRTRENRDKVRAIVKETGVAISSLGIGLLNKVPLATTDEADELVADCLDAMIKMKQEAAEIDDREFAAKVSPRIVLLAFFGKADLNGDEQRMQAVIHKLKRFAPIAEKHGFVLGIESLLSEADHRRIINEVGSPAVKVYYDTANSARMGYDIYGEIESLSAENICEIHIKQDAALLGEGDIDFDRIKSLLKKIDYQGWLIIEGSRPRGVSPAVATKQNAVFAQELFGSAP